MANGDPLAFDRALQDYAQACRYAMAPGADPAWAVHAQALATEITEGPTGAGVRRLLKVARGDTSFRASLPLIDDTLAFVATFEIPPLLPGPLAGTLDDAIRWATDSRNDDLLTQALYLRAVCSRIERARNRALDHGAAQHAHAIRRDLGSELVARVAVRSVTAFAGHSRHFAAGGHNLRTARTRLAWVLVAGYEHGLSVSDLLDAPPAGRPERIAADLRESVANLVNHRMDLGLRPHIGFSPALRSLAPPTLER